MEQMQNTIPMYIPVKENIREVQTLRNNYRMTQNSKIFGLRQPKLAG